MARFNKETLRKKTDEIKKELRNDETLDKARRYANTGFRSAPSVAGEYLYEKLPVIQWLPRYRPQWVINDFIAGLTVGIMLIPQSLAYAKIATIDGQYGLMSSWLPGILYFFMGTSKDLSTGPTSLLGLLTAEAVRKLSEDGYSPEQISSAVAMMVGIYALGMGLLKLGFLLNFISVPVLTGFISATAIVIMLGQVGSIFGLKTRTGTAKIIHDVFSQLGDSDGPTVAIGFSGIIMLVGLQWIGRRWGKKSKIVWYIALARAAIVLILFTGISYGVNKDREDPLWALSQVKADGIAKPRMVDANLIAKAAPLAVTPFFAGALEHLAIAKGFGRKNNYVIDQSQELVYLGLTNFVNSFWPVMSVGGAMSRTAVNSESGVRSPMSHLIASGFVLLSIFKLTGALYWIPKATLAAIIITAVWALIGPASAFYFIWQTSLADFIASMLAFWVTLFVNTEYGIASAVCFSIVYTLLRNAFASVKHQSPSKLIMTRSPPAGPEDITVEPDTRIFRFSQAILFPNAYRIKDITLDTVQTYNAGDADVIRASLENRNWSVSGERKIRKLRAKAAVSADPPPIRLVVLDMAAVSYVDTTGVLALGEFKAELRKYGGKDVRVRFANMGASLRRKFERARWRLVDVRDVLVVGVPEGADVVFDSVADALVGEPEVREKSETVIHIEQAALDKLDV
ncbi:sulfate permease-like protein [Pseudovirgaria hyperparasitica]|uniref:Sulfate permease-like protein n=1 Tax=Pseudovirgaria hyperparasitica TaxID=470096 RepID=A0A6A6VX22_9PEZI|nr:sulfate permease-like protein [Pseudovirgaria hyperparasitica]KAF2754725.1 sulfate permease-like protein [Pseudovirgaria hyperparasitica]